MNHSVNLSSIQTLATQRLILKKIGLNDIEAYMSIAYYDGIKATTTERTKEIIEQIEKDCVKGDSIHWGIFLNDTLVGSCGYYRGFKNGAGEIGCILKEEFRGKGFMEEALIEIINFGFSEVKLTKVIAYTTAANKPAINLLNRLAFVQSKEQGEEYLKFEKTN